MTTRHRGEPAPGPGHWLTAGCVLAVLVVVAFRLDPPTDVTPDARSQVHALLRVVMTALVASVALLGPGLVLRARWRRCAGLPLSFVPLVGLTGLVLVGGGCWATARQVDPHDVAAAGLLLVLLVTAAGSWHAGPFLDRDERRVLVLAGLVLLFAIGRTLWSEGPEGELFAGTISRTLEVGDRPDSRISYHVTSLVAHGWSPYDTAGRSLFAPYSFLDRGPVPGVTAAAVMLGLGTTPTAGLPDQPWSVFDAQGFMAYRVVMMLLALMSLLAVHGLVRAIAGPARAHLAAVVVATTPFVLHEVYFTWPKLAAAALCVLAAHALLLRRFGRGGALVAVGSLMHPLALLAVPVLALLVVLVESRGRRRTDVRHVVRVMASVARLGAGVAAVAGSWRLVNLGRPASGFAGYVLDADAHDAHSFGEWISSRGTSVANTLVPFYRLRDPHDPSINSISAPSGAVVHFFFQYWTSVPFGVGIVFFPLLVLGLARAGRLAPVTVLSLVVVPFVGFAVYWGSYDAGLLREGLHPWVLTALALWALTWPGRAPGGGVGTGTRAVLVTRVVGMLALAVVPTWSAHHALLAPGHGLADACALGSMVAAAAALALSATRLRESLGPGRVDVRVAPRHL